MKPAAKGRYPVNMLDPILIQSRLAQKRWPEDGPMFLAYKLTFRLDLFGKNLTQSARTKLDLSWFCTI